MPAGKDLRHLEEVGAPRVAEHFAGGLLLRREDVVSDDKQEVQHRLSLGCQIGSKLLGSSARRQALLQ